MIIRLFGLLTAGLFLLNSLLWADETDCRRGLDAFAQRNYAQAAAALRQCIKDHPGQPDLYRVLAAAYVQLDSLKSADKLLNAALRSFPEDDSLQVMLARIYLLQKKWGLAKERFQLLHDRHIQEPVYQMWLAQCEFYLGNAAYQRKELEQAAAHLRRAVRLKPDLLPAWQNLGIVLYQSVYADSSARAPLQVEIKRNEFGIPVRQLPVDDKREKLRDELEKVLRRAYNLDMNEKQIAVLFATSLLQRGRIDSGVSLFDTLLIRHPGDEQVWMPLAEFYLQRRAVEKLAVLLQKLLPASPTPCSLYRSMGLCHELMNDLPSARYTYLLAKQKGCDQRDAALWLTEAWLKEERPDQALQIYEHSGLNLTENADLAYTYSALLLETGQFRRCLRFIDTLAPFDSLEARYCFIAARAAVGERNRSAALSFAMRADSLEFRSAALLKLLAELAPEKKHDYLFRAARIYLSQNQAALSTTGADTSSNSLTQRLQNLRDQQDQVKANSVLKQEMEDHFSAWMPQLNAAARDSLLQLLGSEYPFSALVWYWRGSSALAGQDTTGAMEYLQRSLFLDNRQAAAHLAFGDLQIALQQAENAEKSYMRVCTLWPDSSIGYQRMIDLYEKQGNLPVLTDKWRALAMDYRAPPVLIQHLQFILRKQGRLSEARAFDPKQSEHGNGK